MAEAMDGIESGGALNVEPGLVIPSMQRVKGPDLIPARPVVMKDGRQVMPIVPHPAFSAALQAAQHFNFATKPRELAMSLEQAIEFQLKAHQASQALYTTDAGRFNHRTHYPWGGLQSADATTATPGTASQEPDRPMLLSELQVREFQARELQARARIAQEQAREHMIRELARDQQARERIAQEQARDQQARERISQEQARDQQARERIAQEQAREHMIRELARDQHARERIAQEQARDQQARERIAQEQAREQMARDQQARERIAQEQAREQIAQEQARERIAQEQARERIAQEQAREQMARDQQARERIAQDQARERIAQEQPREQMAKKQARDQQARDEQAQDQETREQHQEEKLSLNYSQQLTFQAMLDAKRCPENVQPGSFVPQSLPQKLTREVPEGEKNDIYWEKRHKNNLSAKRSRAKQRIQEHETNMKVIHLEEKNAKMRKEVAMLKKRHRLPLNQSVMTPEERRACELEKESFIKRTEVRLGCRVEDLTGPVSTTVKKEKVKKSTARPPKTASSDVDASVQDGRPFVSHGPSTPAPPTPAPPTPVPFIPPQNWPPVAMQPVFGSIPVQNYLPPAGPSSSSVGSELQGRTLPFTYILDEGVAGFIPPHDVYMQYLNQAHQMALRNCDYVTMCARLAIAGHASAGLNNSKGRHDQRGISTGSSSGALNVRHSNTEVLPANVAQSAAGSRDYVNYMGHAAAMLPPQVHNQFDGHFKVPLPVNPFRRRSSQRSETASSDGQDRFKNQDSESETEGLNLTVQKEHKGLREHQKYKGQQPSQ